jgi:DNA-binding LytR/AlgR family response regulator
VKLRSTTANVNARSEPNHAEATQRPPRTAPRLLVGERQHRVYVLKPEKIDYIESYGNYVKFHVGDLDYLARDSLKRLSEVLAGYGFVRIRRSLLLSIRAIRYAQRLGRRRIYVFTLVSGLCLHSGATYHHAIVCVLPLAKLPTPLRRV